VGVGKTTGAKFDRMEFLDDAADGNMIKDKKGNVAERDIVQFVRFREFRGDYLKYARELLNELPTGIKEYMESKDIMPNNEKVKAKLKEDAMKNARGGKKKDEKKLESIEEDYVDKYVREQKEALVHDMIECGHPEEDIRKLVAKGLYSKDKYQLFEQLNIMREERENANDVKRKQLKSPMQLKALMFNKNQKKQQQQYWSPFEEMKQAEIEQHGWGKQSLLYNPMRHIGIQKEYSKMLFNRIISETSDNSNLQEQLHDRFRKKKEE